VEAPRPLTITPLDTPAGVILALCGEADITNFQAMALALWSHLPAGVTKLILDVENLSFLDSIAMRVLVQVAKVLQGRHGRLTLIRPQDTVFKVLEVSGASTFMLIQR
jgi:anti-sigma B factor antagonist